jgi:hypothetical protein
MGCLSSENLKEREEVLVSICMIAQASGGKLVYIAHFRGGVTKACLTPGRSCRKVIMHDEQSSTE